MHGVGEVGVVVGHTPSIDTTAIAGLPNDARCVNGRTSLSLDQTEHVPRRIANRERAPVAFHLHLQAGPGGRGERTFAGERLAVGESRDYELPLAGDAAAGGDLWVGVTFTDGERGHYNRTFPLP